MAECPELSALEGNATSLRDHLAGCASCRIVVELLDERKRGVEARGRRDECARFEMLIAAREGGTIGGTAAALLEAHLRECADCQAVAATMPPVSERREASSLPAVSTAAYALGREVARGGMGRILVAEDLRIGRPVAVKELLGKAPALAARFEREARVTARLQHPSIVPIYEIGRWPDGTPFYAMRMVEGRTLREAIRDGNTLDERLALLPAVIAAADAVAFAHDKRIIHRDLTPNNILVGAHGDTVVIDWGLAKDLSSPSPEPVADPYRDSPAADGNLTTLGAVIGTAAYMPPEQARGEGVDERADVYALGAILYHVLAGDPPYRASTSEDVVRRVQAGPPPAIRTVAPGAPRDLASIVEKAMSRAANVRYPTAAGLVDELRRFQTGRLVEAHHYSRREKARRWVRSHRAGVLASAASIVVLAIAGTIGIAGVLRERDRAQAGERDAQAQRAASDAAAAALLEESGRQELLNGSSIRAAVWLGAAYSAGNHRPSLRLMLAWAMHDLESYERQIRCDGNVRTLSARSDGREVLGACDNAVEIWNVADGALVRSFRVDGTWFTGAHYSHDGRRIVGYSPNGVAYVWDVATGALQLTLRGHHGKISNAEFSADDKRIVTSGFDGTLVLWDASTGARLITIEAASAAEHGLRGMFSGQGGELVSTTTDGVIKVWDPVTGRLRRTIANGAQIVGWDVEARGDGRDVVCGADGVARIWDLRTGALVASFPGHASAVFTCVLSHDGAKLLTASMDGTAKIWDVATGRLLRSMDHHGAIGAGAFSADDHRVATAGLGSGVKVWDVATGALLGSYEGTSADMQRLVYVGDRLLLGDGSTIHELAGLGDGRLQVFVPPEGGKVSAASADGSRVAVTDSAGRITIWDRARQRQVPTVVLHEPAASSESFVAGVTAGGVAIIDMQTGATVATVPVAEAPTSLDVTPDARRMMIGTPGRSTVWDVRGRHELVHWDAPWQFLGFAPDGRRAVIAAPADSFGSHAEIWDLEPARRLNSLPVGAQQVRGAQFDRDSARLIVQMTGTGFVGSVGVWDVATGHQLRVFAGAFGFQLDAGAAITSVTYPDRVEMWRLADMVELGSAPVGGLSQNVASPDAAVLASADVVGTDIRVRDARDGRVLATFPHPVSMKLGDDSYVTGGVGIRFSPGGDRLFAFANGPFVVVNLELETRSPAEIAGIVKQRASWQVDGARLMTTAVPTARVRGRVTHHGVAVAGASVQIVIPAATGPEPVTGETGPDGRYEIDGLPIGADSVTAFSRAVGAFARNRTVTLRQGDNVLDLDLDLAGSIAGQVVDEQGRPVVGVQVHADCSGCAAPDSGDAITAAGGQFVVPMLMGGGTYTFAVVMTGEHAHRLELVRPVAPVAVKGGDDHVHGLRLEVKTTPP